MANLSLSDVMGFNTILTPYKLKPQIGQRLTNATVSRGSLQSVNRIEKQEEVNLPHWIFGDNFQVGLDFLPSPVVLNNILFYTPRGDKNTKGITRYFKEEDAHRQVGISAPKNLKITFKGEGPFYSDPDYTWAYFYYAVTYYDEVTREESAPFISKEFPASQVNISISIKGIDTSKKKIRLYRLGNYITKFSLVTEMKITSSTIYFLDDKPDPQLSTIMVTKDTLVPPEGLTNLTQHNGTFYGSDDTKLCYSKPGNITAWASLNFFDVGDTIVGLESINGVLLILTKTKTLVLLGDDVKTFHLVTLLQEIGCVAYESIATFKNFAVWLSQQGLAISDGSGVEFVSRDIHKLPLEGCMSSICFRDNYFISYKRGESYNMDFSGQAPVLRHYELNFDNIFFNVNKDKLMVIHEDDSNINFEWSLCTWDFFNAFNEVNKPIDDTYNLYFKSNEFIGEVFLNYFEGKCLTLFYQGRFEIKVFRDGKEWVTRKIESEELRLEDIYFPTTTNELKYLSVSIEGKGEIIFCEVNVSPIIRSQE